MNEKAEQIALMYMRCRINRERQIASASKAVNYLRYQNILVPPPPEITLWRWRAMVQSIIVRGLPT